MSKKKVYEKPSIVDLTGSSASGGICSSGGNLTSSFCSNGPAPAGGACAPTGIAPQYGYCTLGNDAVEGCSSGGIHT
jgi:hypothetical protein